MSLTINGFRIDLGQGQFELYTKIRDNGDDTYMCSHFINDKVCTGTRKLSKYKYYKYKKNK